MALKNPAVLGTKGFTDIGKTWPWRRQGAALKVQEVWAPRVEEGGENQVPLISRGLHTALQAGPIVK